MPKVTESTPAAPQKPAQKGGNGQSEVKPTLVQEERKDKVVYPTLVIKWKDAQGKEHECCPIYNLTFQKAKELIGWETEKEYITRMLSYNEERAKKKLHLYTDDEEKVKKNHNLLLVGYGTDYLLKLSDDTKVRCLYNGRNRPFDLPTAMAYGQDILNRRWAGTTGNPSHTINGETIIVGRFGDVVSGQHRIIGFILACIAWEGNNKEHWQSIWPQRPVLPCIVVYGVSEDPEVIRTLDNVKTRTEADVFYTSLLFDTYNGKKTTPAQRKELSRMMAAATDTLWRRTRASTAGYSKYQTHGESIDFSERHPSLKKCVLHLYGENADRTISSMGVSPGACAALMYMMGSCMSDADTYHNTEAQRDRNEDKLSWDMYDKAAEFFSLLSNPDSTVGQAVRETPRIREGEGENEYGASIYREKDGGSKEERMAVICKAWNLWVKGEELTTDALKLGYTYTLGDDDLITSYELVEKTDVGGIDMGEPEKERKKKDEDDEDTHMTQHNEVDSQNGSESKDDEAEIQERLKAERASKEQETPEEESAGEEKARRAQVEKGEKKASKKIVRKA